MTHLRAVDTPPDGAEPVQVAGITGDPRTVHALAERAARAAEASLARHDAHSARLDRIEQRQNAQENLHAQRHKATLAILGRIEREVGKASGKASVALTVAEDARASRPDDGQLDPIARAALESLVERERAETAAEAERQRSETQINEARAHESIRARAERRTARLKWVGQAVTWLTVGGGLVLLAQHCGGG